MGTDLAWLTGVLAFFWFLLYWILGGVAFALLLLLRLSRIRKVRFGCLFTLYALAVAVTAAYGGVRYSHEAIGQCLAEADNRAQVVTAIFGCGGIGIIGAFVLGASAILFGGLFLLLISRRHRAVGGPPVAEAPSGQPAHRYF